MAADDDLMADPGPVFDVEAAAQQPEPEPPLAPVEELPLDLGWEEAQVRTILTAKGGLLHGVVGVGEQDWAYTEHDLNAIAPPLTRILNRYDATRAAAGTGDELAVGIGFIGYGTRSWRERAAVLKAQAEQEPVPVSGVAAPPGTGPPEPVVPAEMEPVPEYQQAPPRGAPATPDPKEM